MRRKRYFIGGLVSAVLPAVIPGLIGEIVGGGSKKTAAQPQAQAGGASFVDTVFKSGEKREDELSALVHHTRLEQEKNAALANDIIMRGYLDGLPKEEQTAELENLKKIIKGIV